MFLRVWAAWVVQILVFFLSLGSLGHPNPRVFTCLGSIGRPEVVWTKSKNIWCKIVLRFLLKFLFTFAVRHGFAARDPWESSVAPILVFLRFWVASVVQILVFLRVWAALVAQILVFLLVWAA